ncbi:hypothetical protein AB9F37_33285, partial [Rhizobium leguminosarum]
EGIATFAFPRKDYASKDSHEAAIFSAVADQRNKLGLGCGGRSLRADGLAAFHRHTAFGKEPQSLWIDLVFDGEHTRGKAFGRVTGKN